MAGYRIVWLLLPQGRSADRVLLTALAQFRLTPDEDRTLEAFPALLDWPAQADQTAFTLQLDGTAVPLDREPTAEPTGSDGPAGTPSDWWAALFPPSTPVMPWLLNDIPAAGDIISHDLAETAAVITELYVKTFQTATGTLPSYEDLLPDVDPIALGELFADKNEEAFDPRIQSFRTWRSRLSAGQGSMPDDVTATTDAIDFHQRVSSLDQLPALLRRLRIAIPLSAPASAIPDGHGASWLIVTMPTDPQRFDTAPPRTLVDFGPFLTATGHVLPVTDGFLSLGDLTGAPPTGTLVSLDAEGAALKLEAWGHSYRAIRSSDWSTEPLAGGGRAGTKDPAGLPALRTQGMALALRDQQQTTAALAEAALLFEIEYSDGGGATLDADALVTGWRIDIADHGPAAEPASPPTFRSLHARRTRIQIAASNEDGVLETRTDLGVLDTRDEGAVVESGTSQGVGDQTSPVVVIPPALAVWKGWSLSVPAPWLAVEPTPAPGAGPVEDVRNRPLGSLPLDVDFPEAIGLPRLRYGHTYTARARAVDPSGWSLPVEVTSSEEVSTADHTFLRLDPLPPPVTAYVVAADPVPGVGRTADGIEGPRAGESVDRLAIRSLAADSPGTTRVARRLAAPPRTTFETAERHGMLDDADGHPQPALYALWAGRDRSAADGQPIGLPFRPVSLEYVEIDDTLVGLPLPGPKGVPQGPPPPRQLAVDPSAALPYLPDPLAGAVRAWVEPVRHLSAEPRLEGDWPTFRRPGVEWQDCRPFLIVLETAAETTDLRVDRTGPMDQLIVSLAPGEVCRLHLAGALADEAEARLFQLVGSTAAATGVDEDRVARAVLDEPNWMVAPARVLECVHAVQRPLVVPEVRPLASPLVLERAARDRHAVLRLDTPCHVNSTARLEVNADWADPVATQTPAQPPALEEHVGSGVLEVTVPDSASGPELPGPAGTVALRVEGRHALPDTRYRRITYSITAGSRYREYMPPLIRDAAPGPDTDGLRMTETSAAREGFVPSSAPPPPPVVGTVLPAFRWTSGGNGQSAAWRRRTGRTLRVDLGPRWFDSGFNEMLAVLTYTRRLHVGPLSEWGDDPVYPGATTPSLTAERFPLRRTSYTSGADPAYFTASEAGERHRLELARCPGPDLSEQPFAAHLVDLDQQRGRWFCDIAVDTGTAYRPLARFTLARYQPFSVTGTTDLDQPDLSNALSGTARTDFVPLMPDRAVVVNRRFTPQITGETWGVRVLGYGPAVSDEQHRVTVSVQRLAPGESEDLGWGNNEGDSMSIVQPQIPGGSTPPPSLPDPPVPTEVADLPVLHADFTGIGHRLPGHRYRILVCEEEITPTRDPQQDAPRLVYFDTIEI